MAANSLLYTTSCIKINNFQLEVIQKANTLRKCSPDSYRVANRTLIPIAIGSATQGTVIVAIQSS